MLLAVIRKGSVFLQFKKDILGSSKKCRNFIKSKVDRKSNTI